jgi:hypothetical protein
VARSACLGGDVCVLRRSFDVERVLLALYQLGALKLIETIAVLWEQMKLETEPHLPRTHSFRIRFYAFKSLESISALVEFFD